MTPFTARETILYGALLGVILVAAVLLGEEYGAWWALAGVTP